MANQTFNWSQVYKDVNGTVYNPLDYDVFILSFNYLSCIIGLPANFYLGALVVTSKLPRHALLFSTLSSCILILLMDLISIINYSHPNENTCRFYVSVCVVGTMTVHTSSGALRRMELEVTKTFAICLVPLLVVLIPDLVYGFLLVACPYLNDESICNSAHFISWLPYFEKLLSLHAFVYPLVNLRFNKELSMRKPFWHRQQTEDDLYS